MGGVNLSRIVFVFPIIALKADVWGKIIRGWGLLLGRL